MNLPEGWLEEGEAAELQRLAAGKTVLELGAWKGRSTVALASVASYVVSVDYHRGIVDRPGVDSLPDYLASVRGLDNVAIVIAPFERVVPLFDSFFDFCFIDGSHDEDSVYRDTTLAREHVVGPVALHDWDLEGVRDGAQRAMSRPPDRLVDNYLAVYEYLP